MNNLNLSTKLSVLEMQEISAGSAGKMTLGCAAGIVCAVIAFGGLVTCTGGGAALYFAAAGWIVAPSAAALGCK